MNFYRLTPSVDQKIIGRYPQSYDAIVPTTIDDPNYLDSYFFERAPDNVFLPQLKLASGANVTDLISGGFGLLSMRLVASTLLKEIIETSNFFGTQFLRTSLILRSGRAVEYWIINSFEHGFSALDLATSEFEMHTKISPQNFLRKVKFNHWAEIADTYKGLKNNPLLNEYLVLKKPIFKESAILDIFTLTGLPKGGVGWFVSERLKKEIEKAGCTGLIFEEMKGS